MVFVNTQLTGIAEPITDLADGMANGVLLIYMISYVYNLFVPVTSMFIDPDCDKERLANVHHALRLLTELGVTIVGVKAKKIIDGDRRTIVRCMYQLLNAQ